MAARHQQLHTVARCQGSCLKLVSKWKDQRKLGLKGRQAHPLHFTTINTACNKQISIWNTVSFLELLRTVQLLLLQYWLQKYSLFLFFYWSIIALQGCASFSCTTKWISYLSTYIPSLLDLPPIPTPIPPISLPSLHPRLSQLGMPKEWGCFSRGPPYKLECTHTLSCSLVQCANFPACFTQEN